MVLQQTLASYNAWYLIILGLVAIFIALFARRGLWGLVDERLNVRLFPVGYWLGPTTPPAPAHDCDAAAPLRVLKPTPPFPLASAAGSADAGAGEHPGDAEDPAVRAA